MTVRGVLGAIGLTVLLAGCQHAGGAFNGLFTPKIRVPYFEPLTSAELCGGFSRRCQPTNSPHFYYLRDPIDWDGSPRSLIGRSFRSPFMIQSCGPTPAFGTAADDVTAFGGAAIVGRISRASREDFNNQLSLDLEEFLNQAFPNFPIDFKTALKAQIKSSLESSSVQTANISYRRLTATDDYRDTRLTECRNRLPSNHRVIVGVSYITVTGDWTRNRIQDTLASVEATTAFQTLSAELKAAYTLRKSTALAGSFEPLHVPFAFTTLPGRAPPSSQSAVS